MELIPKRESEVEVLRLQQKLFRWSGNEIYDFDRMYNLIYHPLVLSQAWHRLARNKGSRTPGVDGVTVKIVKEEFGVSEWLSDIQDRLRSKDFDPNLVLRKWIPKNSDPLRLRPLGIPTLESRLVQMAMKLILEPIFEAHFKSCSTGFRPHRGPITAVAMVRLYMRPNSGYNWVVEADLRGCFDNINHGRLLYCVKQRVGDKRVVNLIAAFLKAGVMDKGQVYYPLTGTPQGGILSPLLTNIYLDQLDEWYHSRYHALSGYQKGKLSASGQPILRLVRYADDFVIMVKGTKEQALEVLADLRIFVQDTLKMELAEEKSGVHHLKEGFAFLGYLFRRGRRQRSMELGTILLPTNEAVIRFRRKVKELTSRSTTYQSLEAVIGNVNHVINGWGNYFCYGWISALFCKLDHYVHMRVGRWLKKKHKGRTWKWLLRRYLRSDLTGYRCWSWRGKYVTSLSRTFKGRRLLSQTENIRTPYNQASPEQVDLRLFATGATKLRRMELSLRRRRAGGEPGEGKLSRRVRRAVGGNGARKRNCALC